MATIERMSRAAEHAESLIAAFGGNPAGWEWSGDVLEQDPKAPGATPCACGHVGIRYLFPWKHPEHEKRVITGSVCVEAVPYLDPASVAAIRAAVERKLSERRAAEAAAKRAARVAEVAAARAELESKIRAKYGSAMEEARWGYVSGAVYSWARQGSDLLYQIRSACRLKTPAGQLKRLRSIAAYL